MEVDKSKEDSSPQQEGEQMTADLKILQKELDELKDVMSEECFKSAQRLVDKTPPDPKDLLQFLIHLNKDLHHKSAEDSEFSIEVEDQWSYTALFQQDTDSTMKVFPVITGQTFGADQVLLEQVKISTAVETTRNLQECDVIIVFCPITSRVGSDVEAAMREDSVSSGDSAGITVLSKK
ncbi:hypothetical protein EPR50_G00244430 [Perca flavescens]|uniref:Uncharacterized protein n=1 Tax=Perca flavescens TaxID=8167 RepID=A0A484BXU0_PERFV|nr:hypothetical protein EPR50_G00244430 [Perca flavescens]